jgi:hypothetical protein
MKRIMWLVAVMVAAVLLGGGAAWADGDFYVIAGGGSPVGTKITSLPIQIMNPGFYFLTGNLTYSGASSGIVVFSDDVTIDLMGFCLSGPGSSTLANGISILGHKNVEVRNGSLNGWSSCLWAQSGSSRNRAVNLRVENCTNGIALTGSGNLVKGCSADAGSTGIGAAGVATGNTVTNCHWGISGSGTIGGNWVTNCSSDGIYCTGASSVIGNTVVTTGSGQNGITIATADPCLVTQNTAGPLGTPFTAGSHTVNIAGTNAGF